MAVQTTLLRQMAGRFKFNSFWISVLISLVVSVLYVISQPEVGILASAGLLDVIEAKTLDWRFRLRGTLPPPNEIVIVAVDEQTEDDLGRWQSAGRKWLAQLVTILTDGGAAVIGFDLTLAEPDEGAALQVIDAIRARAAAASYLDPAMRAMLTELQAAHDYDQLLAQAIAASDNVVLGMYHFFQAASAVHLTEAKQTQAHEMIRRAKSTAVKFPPGTTSRFFHARPKVSAILTLSPRATGIFVLRRC